MNCWRGGEGLRVNIVLQRATLPITRFIAADCDPRVDDNRDLAEQLTVLPVRVARAPWQ